MQIILTRMAMATVIFLKERPAWTHRLRPTNAPLLTESPEGGHEYLLSAILIHLCHWREFDYIIGESFDLRSWMPATVTLEDQINVGGGMERYTYLASESLQADASFSAED